MGAAASVDLSGSPKKRLVGGDGSPGYPNAGNGENSGRGHSRTKSQPPPPSATSKLAVDKRKQGEDK